MNAEKKTLRKNYRILEEDAERIKLIQAFLESKFGVSDETSAVVAAIRHYSDHVRKGDLK
jgi:hypothetical protein